MHRSPVVSRDLAESEPPHQFVRPSGRRAAAVWAVAIAGVLLAISIGPYTFNIPEAPRLNISWRYSPPHDLALNLLAYIPLGIAVALACRRVRGNLPIAAGAAAGFALSLTAETLQTLIPPRTASWTDVLVNCSGALLGGWLAASTSRLVRTAGRRLRLRIVEAPLAAAAATASAALIVAGTLPFDFVAHTGGLHHSLAAASWAPWAFGGADDVPITQPSLPAVLSLAAGFFAYGFIVALAAREQRRSHDAALKHALASGALLAVLIEALQVFVVSQLPQVMDAGLHAMAAGLGAFFAIHCVDRTTASLWRRDPRLLLHPVLLIPALIVQVALHLLRAAGSSGNVVAVRHTTWLPFANWHELSVSDIAATSVPACGGAALLAATFAAACARHNVPVRWVAATVFPVGVAVTCQLCSSPASLSMTPPVLALLGAFSGCAALRTLRNETDSNDSWQGVPASS